MSFIRTSGPKNRSGLSPDLPNSNFYPQRMNFAAFRTESTRRWLTGNWYLDGNRFQLRQVIQIMACDGFNELAERHLSTLRMQ